MGIEYFGYKENSESVKPTSAHGGFGYLTRKKCEGLAKMGHDVHVFIPAASFSKNSNVESTIEINSVQIHLYKMVNLFDDSNYRRFMLQLWERFSKIKSLMKMLDEYPMDVYQSEEPYLYSLQAYQKSKNQVVVFQDPFDEVDYQLMKRASIEYLSNLSAPVNNHIKSNNSSNEVLKSYLGKFSDNLLHISPIKSLLRKLPNTSVFSEAHFISEKAKKMFNLNYTPGYLPNPQDIPKNSNPTKSSHPSILWLGRWDTQKRPDIALNIAKELPDYDFYFVGTSNDYEVFKHIQKTLRSRYERYPNIHIMDFVSEEVKQELLDKSWTLLNTSAREGLPISFLEAGAHKMSIVSTVNPDLYSSQFGAHANLSNIKDKVRQSVEEQWYKTKGLDAYTHIKSIHETNKILDQHLRIYKNMLEN